MSEYYATRYTPDPGRAKVWRAIVEYLKQKYVNNAESILDLGCGYGDFINNISAKNRIAVDRNPASRTYLENSVHFICSSAEDLSMVGAATIDLVFTSNLLEHLTDDQLEGTAREIRRVLRPEGTLITIQPNYYYAYREYFDDYTHKKAFSHESLKDFFLANGFSMIAMEKRFLPFSLKSRLPKTFMLTKLYLNSPIRPTAKQMLGVFRKSIS